MRFVVLAEGKLKDPALRDWVDEYKKRIGRHASVQEIEARSSQDLAKKVPEGNFVVALEVAGKAFTSVRFAEQIPRWLEGGRGSICFVIGGADGIPEAVSRAADARLSLSAMTLPHRLARVILFEQLYRALCIQRGEPYARES